MNEFESYVYGLLITDGSMSLYDRNKGKVQLEISIEDKDIAEKLFNIIPGSSLRERTRNTNFKNNYTSIIWTNCQLKFRTQLIEWGFPITNKTINANSPKVEYIEKDFWRGIIDGDGSLGFIKDGSPYLSLVTKSEILKEDFLFFLQKNFNIIKHINKNSRDNVYNITIKNEDAVTVSKFLYENNKISLNRKENKYLTIQQWERTRPKSIRRSWTKEEDEYLLNHSIQESSKFLNRSLSSVKNRLYRLKSK